MVVHSLYPNDPRVRRMAIAAREAGHQVDVICLRHDGQAAAETVRGIRVRRMALSHVPGAGPLRILFEYLTFAVLATLMLVPAAVRRRYDVVHVHNPPDFLIVAAWLPRRFGSRVILDVHDLSSHMFSSRFSGWVGGVISRLLNVIEVWASGIADRVVTVHVPYRDELVAHGVAADKLVVVMNVSDKHFGAANGMGRPCTPAETFTVAYTGTVSPWYGVELVVDAVGRLTSEIPDVNAVILGTGDSVEAVRERAHSAGVSDRIEVAGRWLTADEIAGQLSTASCGVIPNLPTELNRFALSTKLFEYIEIGLPAVVARLETLEAHFSDDEVTFFEPGDAGALAVALRWVARHPEEATAKAARARERVARDYSWASNRDRYLSAVEAGT